MQIRPRSPENPARDHPPLKRRKRRTWCDFVESRALENGIEQDAHRVAQRQKQIDYGKNTIAYDRFNALCPRQSRKRGDPMTPLPRQKCSKRSFAGQVTSWKKQVYAYVAKLDPEERVNKPPHEDQPLGTGGNTPAPSSSDKQSCVQEQQTVKEGRGRDSEEEDNFSDMDDIELDDFGNPVGNTPSPLPKQNNAENKSTTISPATIFDAF